MTDKTLHEKIIVKNSICVVVRLVNDRSRRGDWNLVTATVYNGTWKTEETIYHQRYVRKRGESISKCVEKAMDSLIGNLKARIESKREEIRKVNEREEKFDSAVNSFNDDVLEAAELAKELAEIKD